MDFEATEQIKCVVTWGTRESAIIIQWSNVIAWNLFQILDITVESIDLETPHL